MIRPLKTSLVIAGLLVAALGVARPAATVTLESKYPGLSAGALRQAVTGVVSGALLEADGVKITSKDITGELAKMKSPTKEQYTTYQFALLESIAIGKLIEKEAREWAAKNNVTGLAGNELMQRFADSTLIAGVEVSEEETLAFYESNPTMFGGAKYAQVQSAIKSYLRDEKVRVAINKYIATLSTRHTVKISDVWAKQQFQKWIKNPVEQARRSGKPTMVEFGSDNCKPCEMMKPIVADLTKKYAGKVNIVFMHVGKEPVVGTQYGIELIPVQVFYDKDGKENFRHIGFYDKASIEARLTQLGVK